MGFKEFLQSVDDTLNKFGESVSGVVDKMNAGSENLNQSMSGTMDRMGDSLQNTWDNMSKPNNQNNGQMPVQSMSNGQPDYSNNPSVNPNVAPMVSQSVNMGGTDAFTPQPIKQAQPVENTGVSASIVNSVEGPISTGVNIEKKPGVNIKKEV